MPLPLRVATLLGSGWVHRTGYLYNISIAQAALSTVREELKQNCQPFPIQ